MSVYFRYLLVGMSLAIVFTFLFGCAHNRQNAIELGFGYDAHIDQGSNPQSSFTYRNEPKDGQGGCVVEFQHNSAVFQGWPFNREAEDLTNQWSIKWRWVF